MAQRCNGLGAGLRQLLNRALLHGRTLIGKQRRALGLLWDTHLHHNDYSDPRYVRIENQLKMMRAAGHQGTVVLSPIPMADEIALVPVYAWLTLRVARARRKRARELPWSPLAKTMLAGLLVRGGIDATVATVPGVAAVVNATTAVALTQIYGACVDHVCRGSYVPTTFGPRQVLDALRARLARQEIASR